MLLYLPSSLEPPEKSTFMFLILKSLSGYQYRLLAWYFYFTFIPFYSSSAAIVIFNTAAGRFGSGSASVGIAVHAMSSSSPWQS